MLPDHSPHYHKAFVQYLRKGTSIAISLKTAETSDRHLTPRYIWITAGDEKVRPSHAANDGKIFYWSNPPSTGHPGEAINCRCAAVPYADVQDAATVGFGVLFAITPTNRARVIASRVLREAARRLARYQESNSQRPTEKPTPDLKDTKTWPQPPREGRYREGPPSRSKPRLRDEKSLYDEKGGEWRYAPKDTHHDTPHWDYKPAGKVQEWQNISIDGQRIFK